ncbi:MAG: hypothetical protein K2W95_34585 [Candidatus Obscuribacterales bacterium]|nr:hypothetical protein [Candidatus Obscuribacterales bacterium]
MKTRIWTVLVLTLYAFVSLCLPSVAQVVRPGATNLIFYNASNQDVVVMATVPATPCVFPCIQGDGCPTGTTANLRVLDIATGVQGTLTQFGNPSQGWFILKRGQKLQLLNVGLNPITKQVSSCLQGTLFGFGQIGNSCPDFGPVAQTAFPNTTPGPGFNTAKVPGVNLPNGSNAFEATLNLPGTAGGVKVVGTTPVPLNEAIDISCVNGANCKLLITVTPPANGPFWTAGLAAAQGGIKTFRTATTFGNSFVNLALRKDDNCVDPSTGYARPGVYPYGATQCNRYPDPAPPCTAGTALTPYVPAQICAAKNGLAPNNGCGFNRAPAVTGVQQFGGTIEVKYLGPI